MKEKVIKKIEFLDVDNDYIIVVNIELIKRKGKIYLRAKFINSSDYIITKFKLLIKGSKISLNYEFEQLEINPKEAFFENYEFLSDEYFYEMKIYDVEYKEIQFEKSSNDIKLLKNNNKKSIIYVCLSLFLVAIISTIGIIIKDNSNTSKNVEVNKYKVGLGYSFDYSYVDDYNITSVEPTFVFIIVDDNRIYDISIDCCSIKIEYDAENDNLIENSSYENSKMLLMDKYGMKEYSDINKEYYEQILSFCDWCRGKTCDDLNSIITNFGFLPDELLSCITINTSGIILAIDNALKNLSEEKYIISGKTAVGIAASASYYYADHELEIDFSGLCINDNRVVEAALVDCMVVPLICESSNLKLNYNTKYFNKKELLTKKALKYEYGMSFISSFGYDWFQYAEVIENELINKDISYLDSLYNKDEIISEVTIYADNIYKSLLNAENYYLKIRK